MCHRKRDQGMVRVSSPIKIMLHIIKKYFFRYVHQYLEEQGLLDILTDPERVYNCDETGVQFNAITGKFICFKKIKNLYIKEFGDSKKMMTLLITASASGEYLKPFLLHPAKTVNEETAESISKFFQFHCGGSWMTNELFLYYLKNVSIIMQRGMDLI